MRKAGNAYKTYLDNLRIECFERFARQVGQRLQRRGVTDNDVYAREMAGIARFINYATGRGDWSSPTLNATFFSTRYWESRLQLLNPIFYGRLPSGARRLALKNMAGFVGATALMMLLWKLDGGEVEYDDPNNPDALKLKWGKNSYDIGAGLVQHLRFFARLGKTTFGEKPERGTRLSAVKYQTERYVRSKLAPVPGSVWNALEGQNYIGEPTSWGEEVFGRDTFLTSYTGIDPLFVGGLTSPLSLGNFYEAAKEDGSLGFIKTLPETVGFGVTRYKDRKQLEADLRAENDKFAQAKTVEEKEEIERRVKLREKLLDKYNERNPPTAEENLSASVENFQQIMKEGKLNEKQMKTLGDRQLKLAEKQFQEGEISADSIRKVREVFKK